MWLRGALRAVAATAFGAIALAVARAVVDGVVGREIGGFSWPMMMFALVLSIVVIAGFAAVKVWGARRRPGVAPLPAAPADSIDVPGQTAAGVSRSWSIEPDSRVTYRPSLRRPVWFATLVSVGWLGLGLVVVRETGGRWSAGPCYEYYSYNCAGNTPLALLLFFGVLIGSVLTFAAGWRSWSVRRLRPARLPGFDSYTKDPADEIFVGLAVILAFVFLVVGIWSAVLGAMRYAHDQSWVVAAGFVLTAVDVLVVLAAWGRTGYVAALRNAARRVALPTRRHYPNPPAPSMPTVAARIAETVTRRAFRPRGKAALGFEPDPWADLLDELSLIPSVRTFTLAGRITAVVADRRVAVLACVQWPPGRYARHGELSVTRDGHPYQDPGGTVAATIKVLRWLSMNLPAGAVVRAFTVVTTETAGVVKLDNGTGRLLRLVRAVDAPAVISAFLAARPNVIDRGVALAVWRAGLDLTGSGFDSQVLK